MFSHQAKPQGEPNPNTMLPAQSVASIQPVPRLAPAGAASLAGGWPLVVSSGLFSAVCFQKSSAQFSCTTTAVAIREKLKRPCSQISGTCWKSATLIQRRSAQLAPQLNRAAIWAALRVSRSISSADINTHEAAMRTKTPSIHQGWSSISPGRQVLLNQGSNGP